MNGTQQNAHQQIITAIESTVPAIIARVIEQETQPLKNKIDDLKALVNQTQDQANLSSVKAADLVQQKQDQITGLQNLLSITQKELANTKSNLDLANSALDKAHDELGALKAPK